MATDKKKETALKKLTPDAIDVKINGQDVRVATNKDENAIMNMIMASQLRSMLQAQIQKYQDDDNKLTPKEIADLAKAGRDIAQFSAEVYATGGMALPPREKPAEKPAEDLDFSKLGQGAINVSVAEEQPTDGGGQAGN